MDIVKAAEMKAPKALFMNSLLNCRFSFKDGTEAIFLNGEFYTDNEEQIKELLHEIKLGHPFISQIAGKEIVDTAFVDPMEAIRAKVIAEYEAQQAALRAGQSTTEDSTSDQNQKIVVGNTTTAGEAMSGSTSVDGGVSGGQAPAPGTASGVKIVAGPRG